VIAIRSATHPVVVAQRGILRQFRAQYVDIVVITEPGLGVVEQPNVFSDTGTARVDKP
jgi:hypothetical protein